MTDRCQAATEAVLVFWTFVENDQSRRIMQGMNTATVGGAIGEPLLVGEASRLLGVSTETVRTWARNGRIGVLRTSHGVRLFDRADVERIARERATAASSTAA